MRSHIRDPRIRNLVGHRQVRVTCRTGRSRSFFGNHVLARSVSQFPGSPWQRDIRPVQVVFPTISARVMTANLPVGIMTIEMTTNNPTPFPAAMPAPFPPRTASVRLDVRALPPAPYRKPHQQSSTRLGTRSRFGCPTTAGISIAIDSSSIFIIAVIFCEPHSFHERQVEKISTPEARSLKPAKAAATLSSAELRQP